MRLLLYPFNCLCLPSFLTFILLLLFHPPGWVTQRAAVRCFIAAWVKPWHTCTPTPACGEPRLEGKRRSCGGVGRGRLMPWLCCPRGGRCEGGLYAVSLVAFCLGGCWQGGWQTPSNRAHAVVAAAQFITEEEPEVPPSFSSPAWDRLHLLPTAGPRGQRSPWKFPAWLSSCCVAICFAQDSGIRLCGKQCSSSEDIFGTASLEGWNPEAQRAAETVLSAPPCPKAGRGTEMTILWDIVSWEPGLKHPPVGNLPSWFQNHESSPAGFDPNGVTGPGANRGGENGCSFKHTGRPGVVLLLPKPHSVFVNLPVCWPLCSFMPHLSHLPRHSSGTAHMWRGQCPVPHFASQVQAWLVSASRLHRTSLWIQEWRPGLEPVVSFGWRQLSPELVC